MELHLTKILLLLLAFTSYSFSDQGFCSINKDSGSEPSCSGGKGSKDTPDSALKEAAIETLVYQPKEETANETDTWNKLAYKKMAFTNELDWSIREDLDLADEFITEEPEKAIQMFKKILSTHPGSVRAQYALVRSMQFVNTTTWTKEKKDKHNQEILEGFMNIMKRDESEVLFPIYYSAAHQGLLHSVEMNDTAKKTEILKLAISLRSSKHQKFHELLVYEHILTENYAEALKAADAALEEFHQSHHFKFLKGIILKKLDRKKEANALLRSFEAAPNEVFAYGTDVMELCFDLTKKGREQDVDMIYKEASKIHLFMSRYQRPMEVVPDLESKPVWSLQDDVGLTTHDEELSLLRQNLKQITAEALELRKNTSLWMRNEHYTNENGTWEEFPLYSWGKRRSFHCSLAPKTCEVLKKFPAASSCRKCTIKFHVLGPKTHVRPHVGPTNARLRLHVPLQTPQGEAARMRVGKDYVHVWSVGKEFVFDDSFEHEMWNDDEKVERIVLSVDLPHPDVREERATFSAEAKSVYLLI